MWGGMCGRSVTAGPCVVMFLEREGRFDILTGDFDMTMWAEFFFLKTHDS